MDIPNVDQLFDKLVFIKTILCKELYGRLDSYDSYRWVRMLRVFNTYHRFDNLMEGTDNFSRHKSVTVILDWYIKPLSSADI